MVAGQHRRRLRGTPTLVGYSTAARGRKSTRDGRDRRGPGPEPTFRRRPDPSRDRVRPQRERPPPRPRREPVLHCPGLARCRRVSSQTLRRRRRRRAGLSRQRRTHHLGLRSTRHHLRAPPGPHPARLHHLPQRPRRPRPVRRVIDMTSQPTRSHRQPSLNDGSSPTPATVSPPGPTGGELADPVAKAGRHAWSSSTPRGPGSRQSGKINPQRVRACLRGGPSWSSARGAHSRANLS